MKRCGIMGGTFDPVHYGHLVTAEAAREEFGLERVIFVPSGRPPHKKEYPVTVARHRYIMTILAVATNPSFEVSRIEIDRPGLSYAVDTVAAFQQQFGPETELFFITGADAILEILSWKNVEELLGRCHFVAATRPGFDLGEIEASLDDLLRQFSGRIFPLAVPALAISSTDVRRRVETGRSIKYLVPEAVEHYIVKNHLYLAEDEFAGRGEKKLAGR